MIHIMHAKINDKGVDRLKHCQCNTHPLQLLTKKYHQQAKVNYLVSCYTCSSH